MKALLIEDDQFKVRHLLKALDALHLDLDIDEARSVNASLRALEQAGPFDLVILDMSLPMFDVGPRESGGQPQGFGGREIMHYMQSSEMAVPVIVVTQFEKFGEGSHEIGLDALTSQLQRDFPDLMRGVVYYNAASDKWKQELEGLVRRVHDGSGGAPQ